MEWYEFQTMQQKEKLKDPNAKEKYFITRQEYEKLIQTSTDIQEKALWEILYLSGARPSEILSMAIGHVQDNGDGFIISVPESKTRPRKIPLNEFPEYLRLWLEKHPYNGQMEKPLWIKKKYRTKQWMPMNYASVREIFYRAIKAAKIKQTLTLKSFRKTRATLMFSDTEKNYKDSEIALFFGWSNNAVGQRRCDYDLTGFNDLLKKVHGDTSMPPSYEKIKYEKEQLEHQHQSQIDQIKEQMNVMQKQLHTLSTPLAKSFLQDGNIEPQDVPKEVMRFQKNAEKIIKLAQSKGVSKYEIDKYKDFIEKLLT